jgi:hypothetical protein
MQDCEGVTEGEAVTATLTRQNVAAILGVSVAKVRRMEGKELHPSFVDGKWLFDVVEVRRLQSAPKRASTDGEVAAEVFERFDTGQSIRQIVRECKLAPELVFNLYRYWDTSLGESPDIDGVDSRAQQRQEEQDLARWEEEIRAMITADEERDLQERRERDARQEHWRTNRRNPRR